MLGNDPFNFHSIEKITAAFGYIFRDITIQRIDPVTAAVKNILVPISQAAKEKWAVRELEDPDAGDEPIQRHVQIVLPRMGYDLVDLRYDPHRKLPSINYRVAPTGNGPYASVQLNPVPMIYKFSLYMQARTLSDSYAIVEQILSFFRPDYVVPINDIPEMNIKRDVIVVLTGTNHTDSYQGSLLDKRIIEWQFDFDVFGYIYPPIKLKPVINQVDVYVNDQCLSGVGPYVDVRIDPPTANIDDDYNIVVTDHTD